MKLLAFNIEPSFSLFQITFFASIMVYGGKRENEGGIKTYFRCCRQTQPAITDTPAAVDTPSQQPAAIEKSEDQLNKSYHERE